MRYFSIVLFSVFCFTSHAFAQDLLDQYYSPEEMAHSRMMLKKMNGGQNYLFLMADRFEYVTADNGAAAWELNGWYGGDKEKIWFKSEGEYEFENNDFEEADIEALYSRAISPYFDFQAGLKQDFRNGPDRTYAVVGLMGLAPYWFELDSSFQVSNKGDLAVNFEVEYEILLTQRLILQPKAEFTLNFQDVPEIGIGSGLSSLETGLRLRYEIRREFAPYVGISWHKAFGDTANYLRQVQESTDKFSFLIGIRAWY